MTEKVKSEEYIRVTRNSIMKKTRITGCVLAINYYDEESEMWISYMPSFNLSGYGKTEKLASDMIEACLDTYLKGLIRLSKKERDRELLSLGWSHRQMKKKEYVPN